MLLDLVHVHLKDLLLVEAIEAAPSGARQVPGMKAGLKAGESPTSRRAGLVYATQVPALERAWEIYKVRVPALNDASAAEHEDELLTGNVQVSGGSVDIP